MKTLTFQIFTLATVLFFNFSNTLSGQNTMSVTSTQKINATKQQVMNALKHYEEFPNWSPFLISDPEQKYVIQGPSGQVGSSFAWEGVAEDSKGVQTIAEINGNDYIRMECEVVVPFEANSIFEYELKEKDGVVHVTQNFRSSMGAFTYFMAWVFGAEAEIAEINRLGLQRLKSYVEGSANSQACL